MDKQNAVYPYNRMLFSNKKQQTADNLYNRDGPQKREHKENKPEAKDHIFYDFIYMNDLKRQIYRHNGHPWLTGAGGWHE